MVSTIYFKYYMLLSASPSEEGDESWKSYVMVSISDEIDRRIEGSIQYKAAVLDRV